MNILYIGPYRQNNLEGLLSYNIVKNIQRNHNITSRPFYYDGSCILKNTDTSIEQSENNQIQNFDCLIQHVPMNLALRTQQFAKNIVIPIIDDTYDYDFHMSDMIDKLLVDNEPAKNLLDSANIYSDIYDYDIDTANFSRTNKFDLGSLNSMTKLYFIGEYSSNYDIIYSLIRGFLYLRSDIPQEYCLVLFVINSDKTNLSVLETYIKQAYNSLNALNSINRIVIVPIGMDIVNILAAHNSGDIFLDFNTYPKNTINKKIATFYDKKIINLDNSNNNYSLTNNSKISKYFVKQQTDKEIVDSIKSFFLGTKNISNSKNKKSKTISKIEDIICQ